MYQKYFGRAADTNGNTGELTFWQTQPITALEAELAKTYQSTTGIPYDGSPVPVGATQTHNQLTQTHIDASQGGLQRGASEPTTIKQQADGTYSIIGAQSGTVIQGGFTNLAQALATQQQQMSGSTPQLTGQPNVDAIAPVASDNAPANTPVATVDANGQLIAPAATAVTDALKTAVDTKAAAAEQAGQQVTAAMRAQWLSDAYTTLKASPDWQQQIKSAELDLGTSFDQTIRDASLAVSNEVAKYGQTLENTQTGLRDKGMLYGGVRQLAEQKIADTANAFLQDIQNKQSDALQNASQTAERYLGSTDFQNGFNGGGATALAQQQGNYNQVGRVLAGSPTYTMGGSIPKLNIQGGMYGTAPTAVEGQARTLASQAEDAFNKPITQSITSSALAGA